MKNIRQCIVKKYITNTIYLSRSFNKNNKKKHKFYYKFPTKLKNNTDIYTCARGKLCGTELTWACLASCSSAILTLTAPMSTLAAHIRGACSSDNFHRSCNGCWTSRWKVDQSCWSKPSPRFRETTSRARHTLIKTTKISFICSYLHSRILLFVLKYKSNIMIT